MTRILKLNSEEIKSLIAEKFEVPAHNIVLDMNLMKRDIVATINLKEEKIEETASTYWEYWGGLAGNHDKRIDDAKCSNCGFKHPTVRGGNAPDQLYKFCPRCGRRMGRKEV